MLKQWLQQNCDVNYKENICVVNNKEIRRATLEIGNL